jgi:hypothetical protein
MNKQWYRENMMVLRKYNSNHEVILKDAPGVAKYYYTTYNCFGYAMGYYDWLDLESFYIIEEEDEDDLICMFEDCCNELSSRYGLRPVFPHWELEKDEHLIAFRVGYDDFHFARKNSDGTWTHKPGSNFIRKMSEEEFNSEWCPSRECPYISPIAYFAVKTGGYKWYED